MDNILQQNARAVLLPAFSELQLSEAVKRFLAGGGCSLLIGETREEYVARKMTTARKRHENPELFCQLRKEAVTLSASVLIAVDQEISGICRLHDLVDPFPSDDSLQNIGAAEFEKLASRIARQARKLGVNCFLGPILDVVTGTNPWLSGRTWTCDPKRLAEISSAYIRGVQSCGVAATAKHFPGYSTIPLDPAVEPEAKMTASVESVTAGLLPFEDAIRNNVEIVMTGPAIVEAIDPITPASLSSAVIDMLRDQLNFQGLVLSDDLDAKATLRDKSLETVAVKALCAGADLLLVGDVGDRLERLTQAIVEAAKTGKLSRQRLSDAAEKVRRVAGKYSHTAYREASTISSPASVVS